MLGRSMPDGIRMLYDHRSKKSDFKALGAESIKAEMAKIRLANSAQQTMSSSK